MDELMQTEYRLTPVNTGLAFANLHWLPLTATNPPSIPDNRFLNPNAKPEQKATV